MLNSMENGKRKCNSMLNPMVYSRYTNISNCKKSMTFLRLGLKPRHYKKHCCQNVPPLSWQALHVEHIRGDSTHCSGNCDHRNLHALLICRRIRICRDMCFKGKVIQNMRSMMSRSVVKHALQVYEVTGTAVAKTLSGSLEVVLKKKNAAPLNE